MPFDNSGIDFSQFLNPQGMPNTTVSGTPMPTLVRPQNRPQPQQGAPAANRPAAAPANDPALQMGTTENDFLRARAALMQNPSVAPGQSAPTSPAPMMAAAAPAQQPNPFGAAGNQPMAALAASAPRQNADGSETIFPAGQNAALQSFLRGSGGQTPGGALPAGMVVAPAGVQRAMPMTEREFQHQYGGVFSPDITHRNIEQNALLRDQAMRQQREMAAIPGAIAAQNARFAGGLFTDAQRAGIAQYDVNPMHGGGIAHQAANDASARTRFEMSDVPTLRSIALGVIANGGNEADIADAVRGFRGGIGASQPSAGNNASVQQPTVANTAQTPQQPAGENNTTQPVQQPVARNQNAALDRYLRNAMASAGVPLPVQAPGQPRVDLMMPAQLPQGADPNAAITNFVSSLQSGGGLNAENVPEVMRYMTQRFGANRVNPWFQRNFWLWDNSPHRQAVRTISDLANTRGANIGPNTAARVSRYLGGDEY